MVSTAHDMKIDNCDAITAYQAAVYGNEQLELAKNKNAVDNEEPGICWMDEIY